MTDSPIYVDDRAGSDELGSMLKRHKQPVDERRKKHVPHHGTQWEYGHHCCRCSICREAASARSRQWKEANKDLLTARRRKDYTENLEWYSWHGKHQRLGLKREVVGLYGGCCACCGETELAFLTMDHVDGDGALERRTKGMTTGKFYRWLRKNPIVKCKYQVLCFNCNAGRQVNGGTCPHKETRRARRG